jgi:DNA-binding GntR family transcriptional regulator
MMLEVPAVRGVVERASDTEIEALRPTVEAIMAAAADGDLPAFLTADRAFHLGLLELTGNRRLLRLIAELRDQTRLTGLSGLAAHHLQAAAAEHAAVLDAVRDRDADRAERLMCRHLEHTRGIWAGQDERE